MPAKKLTAEQDAIKNAQAIATDPDSKQTKWKANVINFADVEPEELVWLWEDRLLSGKLQFLAGFPDVGKSLITCDIAARISTGAAWPDDRGNAPQGHVLFLASEDGIADTIVPRLDAAGADRQFIHGMTTQSNDRGANKPITLQLGDLEHITNFLLEYPNTRLIVIDPVSEFLGDTDENSNKEIRTLLKPVGELAEDFNVAVLVVSHNRKAPSNGPAMHRVTGTQGMVARCRHGHMLIRDKDDQNRRHLVNSKGNLCRDRSGLTFEIVDGPRINFIGTTELTADELMSEATNENKSTPTKREQARNLLISMLANGPVPVATAKAQADLEGIEERTLQRAIRDDEQIEKKSINGKQHYVTKTTTDTV